MQIERRNVMASTRQHDGDGMPTKLRRRGVQDLEQVLDATFRAMHSDRFELNGIGLVLILSSPEH